MKQALTVAAVLLLARVADAQSAGDLQKQLNLHADAVRTWAADKTIADAVRAQNAKGLTLAAIQKDDKAWVAGGNAALVKTMTTGACADRIRALASSAGYGEAFVMDNQGALVCATDRTSDYWQGDEIKWTRAFNDGKGATFIDRPRLDDSAKTSLAQISVPVMSEGRAVGVITAGVPLTTVQAKR